MNTISHLILLITIFFSPLTFCMTANNVDLDLFGGQNMDQALEDFLKELQNLSPEDQKMLEDLGKQMEEDMKNRGLDPMNPDDIFKWAEVESEMPSKEPIKHSEGEIEKEIAPKKPIKPIEVPALISSPENALMILQAIIKHLASARQKAIFYPDLSEKIDRWTEDLNQLNYFVHVLEEPDLVKHIISKPYEKLYKSLESLYNTLLSNESNIQVPATIEGEDNPYTILNIQPYSSQKEIDDAYSKSANLYSEKTIRETFNKLPERDLKKRLKEAKLSFSFTEDAYTKLKDPKERKQLDRLLSQQIRSEKESFINSSNALNNIISGINKAIFQDKIITEIKQLLEKYKPQEIEKAKAQEKLEKQILDKSKQPIRVVPSPKTQEQKGGYEEFYRKMSQEKNKQVPYPKRPTSQAQEKSGKGKEGAGPKGSSKKEGGDPKEKGGGAGKKPEDDKKKKDEDNKKKADESKKAADDKKKADVKKADMKKKVEALNKQDKEKIDIPTRSGKLSEPEAYNLRKALVDLDLLISKAPNSISVKVKTGARENTIIKNESQITQDLKTSIKVQMPILSFSVENFLKFAETNNFEKIYNSVKEITEKHISELGTPEGTQLLDKYITKHSKKVTSWFKSFYELLSQVEKMPNKKEEPKKSAGEKEEDKKDRNEITRKKILDTKNHLDIINSWFNNVSQLVKNLKANKELGPEAPTIQKDSKPAEFPVSPELSISLNKDAALLNSNEIPKSNLDLSINIPAK